MKKVLAIVLTLAMVFAFAACNNTDTTTSSSEETSSTDIAVTSDVKTGMAVVTSAASSKDATEDKNGTAQVDATVAAVTVDADGKIVACKIDTVQGKVAINAKGEIVTEAGTEILSKKELGDNYGMRGNSSISKEWFEQIAAFEQYVIGKTSDEVKAIAVDESGYPAGDDLRAGCTMGVSDYIEAVAAACENATAMGASAEDTLKLATIATVSSDSANATEDKDGKAQISVTFAAVTVNGDKVTSCKIDELAASVAVTATGTIGEATATTKKALGDNYGMKGLSPIGKEWFEQVDALEKYVAGNNEITLNAEGYADSDDLKAGCTINLFGLKAVVDKAVASK